MMSTTGLHLRRCKSLLALSRRTVVSTKALPPLASAFNAKAFPRASSLFFSKDDSAASSPASSVPVGLFCIPHLTCVEGFGRLKEECIDRSMRLVDEAVDVRRGRLLTAVFDDLSDELCKVADMAEFVRLAHPEQAMASAAEEACIDVSGLVEKLNTHLGLYRALSRVVSEGDSFPETDVDKHVGKLFLLDFQQCGIHLDDESRQMVVGLNDYILQVGQQFAAGTHRAAIVKKSTFPANIRHLFHVEGENVILNGLNVDSSNDLVREAAYKSYYMQIPEQEALLGELLVHRHHLAQLCDYPTFGHRAMIESLGGSPEKVSSFLGHLSKHLQPRLAEDYAAMSKMKKQADPLAKNLEVWDIPFYAMQAKSSWFDVNTDRLSEFFSLGVCMEGLNTIFQTLFSVELVMETAEKGELWHPDVYKLSVRDVKSAEVLGLIYCDFFARSGKPYQDCHFTIRGGRQLADGTYQNPVVVLMLNLPPSSPGWTAPPTLLSGPMIDNLFHEMGHAMHSMLARTKYQHVTGTRCSTDFAEVPSTLMEYFSSDPRVLSSISRHYKTGESLPLDVCAKFCATKKVFSAVDIHTQLFYSLIDQTFHGEHPLGSSTTDVLRRLHGEHHNLAYHEGTAWHHRFSHLVGYGARYYSYLMARSVASSIWQQYFQDDPFSQDAGAKYRRECLAHGGGKPSISLVSDFLGRDVLPEDLSQALIDEIDTKNETLAKIMHEDRA